MESERFLPPQSLESEMSVLGAIFLDGDVLATVLEIITAEDFYREAHRKIFKAMCLLIDKSEPCDFVTLTGELKRAGVLESIGGAAYLMTLVDYVPTSANVAFYCKAVAEKSLERRLLSCAQETVAMIQNNKPAAEVIEKLESSLTVISMPQKSEPVPTSELVMESVRRLKTRNKNGGLLQGMSWGIEELDNATTGIHKGELIIIAGRPSMGKTALAGNVLRSVCVNTGSGILFSLEMSRVDCTDRFISDLGNIKNHHLRTGQLTDVEWASNARACNDIMKWKLFIDDTPAITLSAIKSKAKKQKRKGLDLIVVDYLQLMGVSNKDSRVLALGEISRGLKQLARELDIAVILLSQLNREVDKRPDKRPLMSDLRDSGEIEQDADVIIFPFRPAAYCQKCRDKVDDCTHSLHEHQAQAEIIVEKQRNGERNLSIPVAWVGQHQRFECLSSMPRF